jgi:hypothetical protein
VVIDPARRVGAFVAFDNASGKRMAPVATDANDLVGLLGAPWRPGVDHGPHPGS